MAADQSAPDIEGRTAVLLTLGLGLLRLLTLFGTPLELYPDEAQYWLWSRTLAFGYYSKPPLIAWSIWASTAPWVKLRRSRSISQAPKVSSLATSETSMKML